AINDADFASIRGVVDDVSDFGESGRLESGLSRDRFERRLDDETVLGSAEDGGDVERLCRNGGLSVVGWFGELKTWKISGDGRRRCGQQQRGKEAACVWD